MAWEAFETGGIKPSLYAVGVEACLSGSRGRIGPTAGRMIAGFGCHLDDRSDRVVSANRISYQFDLRGPSVAVDTACSSSLVAFHQGMSVDRGRRIGFRADWRNHAAPASYAFVGFARASMLSPRGVCNVLTPDGDGYPSARRGGDLSAEAAGQGCRRRQSYFAVVAGSGINCDGRTQGITVPGVDTQAALLREVYAALPGSLRADIDYLEAHGTGTAVGDPIECRSLGLELGQNRPKDAPLLIRSVKEQHGAPGNRIRECRHGEGAAVSAASCPCRRRFI